MALMNNQKTLKASGASQKEADLWRPRGVAWTSVRVRKALWALQGQTLRDPDFHILSLVVQITFMYNIQVE